MRVGLDDFNTVAAATEPLDKVEVSPSAPTKGQADWDWPAPLSDAAYHGVAGDVVRVIEPETQADPAAVLIQLLTAVGAACGRGAGFTVDESRHGVNLFVQIVGDSGTSRKGSSFSRAVAPVLAADATLSHTTGLSSGEGLIWEVRDPIEQRRKARTKEERERADEDGYITELLDEGVYDKRLLIAETEFASVLARMGREGNTLSAVIRQAWEGSVLRTMTKGRPAVATGAHVSVVAHITAEELRQKLSATDALSGFANRFLWVCAKRSKSLPRGGRQIEWRDSSEVEQIRQAIRFAQLMPNVDFDRDAGDLWDSGYERLETSRTGLLAAVTNRAAAQTRRLATLYALLDCSDTITVEHLAAALEIWAYCENSARFLFSDRTGDPDADVILQALRNAGEQGLTRTEIRDLFSRNRPERIPVALSVLLVRGLARMQVDNDTGGRPAERWWTTRKEAT